MIEFRESLIKCFDSHVGWVRRGRNPTWSRKLRPLLGYDTACLTQPTKARRSRIVANIHTAAPSPAIAGEGGGEGVAAKENCPYFSQYQFRGGK